MKKFKFNILILAAALAVGLGVTGIAATAQAAEEKVISKAACDHPEDAWIYQFTLVSYDTRDISIFYHIKYTMKIYRCNICGYIIYGEEVTETEPHELVYNPSNDRYECTHCDFWE